MITGVVQKGWDNGCLQSLFYLSASDLNLSIPVKWEKECLESLFLCKNEILD